MDPLTLATGFASIVGLLGVYKAEVHGREGRDFDAYVDWLRRREHAQLVDLLVRNEELSQALRELIQDQHGEVVEKLQELDTVLSTVARHVAEFQPLADAIRTQSGLSQQAASILRQLNQANASQLLEAESLRDTTYMMMDGRGGQLKVDETRFIKDDLDTLCELGLLREDGGGSGSRVFRITRAGATVGG